jgi:membrane-associated phospholipid phosphatase
MVVPTLILAIYILLTEKEHRDGNWTLFFWLLMNITWMLHELQNLPYWPVQIFMLLGIFNTLRLIVKRRKNESNIS